MPFSAEFLLGAATAAHQVEGSNIHSDAWALEHMTPSDFYEPSGDACDHYHRYEEDIRLLADAGLNAYRFSIEWARIEPNPGEYDYAEVAHYRDVIACCRRHGVEPIVTLHHFTSPVWLIRKGGWEAASTVADFARYAGFIAKELGDDLRYICTINEANMGASIAALIKDMMAKMAAGGLQIGLNMNKGHDNSAQKVAIFGTANPQWFLAPRTEKGDGIIMRAHTAAREAIKAACPHIKVGLTLSLHDVQSLPGGESRAIAEWDTQFRHYLPAILQDDFLGVQNYTRTVLDENGAVAPAPDAEKTQMDYEFYPEGLAHVLRKVAADFPGELLVTENGVATTDDTRRVAYIREALAGVRACIAAGLPVKGYLYWSLLDNFEWQKGYGMTFGLMGVDRASQRRIPKPSLTALGRERNA